MSNIVRKLSNEVKTYVIKRKRINPELSCRTLSVEASHQFKLNISKSSINQIFKEAKLSSPVGRRVVKTFRPSAEAVDVGFSFLFGANLLLGLSKILASSIKKALPAIQLKNESLEVMSEAWIMAKAIYNVPLEKIENYSKNEMWFITGRKANKGHLKQYIETFKMLQTINYQIVSELSHILQDIHYLRISLADGAQYSLDGQLKSVWGGQPKIPLDFSVTLNIADSYINKVFFGEEPIIVFNARPESILGDEITDFVFSLDGSSSPKRIRKIELISPKASVVKEVPFVVPERRRFLIGIWPWQYKAISELEKKPSQGKVFLEPLGADFHFVEDRVRFSQHAHNIEVALRLIVIKASKDGPARLGILTNLEPEEWDTHKVVESFVRQAPNFEAAHRLFLSATKSSAYYEDFVSSEKILNEAKKLTAAADADAFFAILVEILNSFAKRSFFPSACSNWSSLKMRELFYKKAGHIKRDMAQDIVFKLFTDNMLEEKETVNFAAVKFNEAPLIDFSGRKIWILAG